MTYCCKDKSKIWYKDNILKEASKKSCLATKHLRETLYFLVNLRTFREAKTLQVNGSYYILDIDGFEGLVDLEIQFDCIN